MQYSLMQAIFNFIIDNRNEFQLHNATTEHFRVYIYDDKGEYQPHGGKEVGEFIGEAIKLMNKGAQR